MIELIIVIIILGIVSSIGSEIIANIYKNYLLQRATHRASLKTEVAAQQIANYLSYRIPKTTLARNPNDITDNIYVTDPTNATDITHTTLEWIGMAHDSFEASTPPGWSGFCDVDASSQAGIKTPGSQLTLTDTIMRNLSNGDVDLTGSNDHPAIFFKSRHGYSFDGTTPKNYLALSDPTGNPACLGMVSTDRSCISTVSGSVGNDDTLSFQIGSSVGNKVITEHYKLARSAYAIIQKDNGRGLYDLKLCYNYQPWEGERLGTVSSSNDGCPGTLATIVTNVSVFKFAESGATFRFKLCTQEYIGEDYNVTICKEKAVIQ